MRVWRFVGRAAVLAFCPVLMCWVSGCVTGINNDPYFMNVKSSANVYVRPQSVEFRKVAMMPFKAPTELIGSSVSDLFVTEMLRTERYDMVERSQIAKVLGETELAMSGLSSSKAVEAAKMVGAEAVIIGTVDEYSMQANGGRTYAVVGISARLIDCNSGQVIWTVDHSKRAAESSVTVSQHARLMVHEMTAVLYKKLVKQKLLPRVSSAAPPVYKEPGAVMPAPVEMQPAAAAGSAPAITVASDAPVIPGILSKPDEVVVDKIPKPTGLHVSEMGLREVSLSWTRLPEYLKECRIERAAAAAGPFEELARVSASKTAYADRGSSGAPLQDGVTYYYRIVGVAANGPESEASNVAESTTAPPPEPPESITAEASASRAVALTWKPSMSEGVVKYILERGIGEQFEKVTDSKCLKFTDGGTADSDLKDKTKYLYRVSSVNRVGSIGAPSRPVEVVTLPRPAIVEAFDAAQGGVRCVHLSWAASPEQDVVRYDLFRKDGQDGEFKKLVSVKGRENTRHVDGGKEPGRLQDAQTYSYFIRAINAVTSESPDSGIIKALTRGAPPAPVGMKAESARPREVPLTWTISSDEKVSGYVIFRADSGSDKFEEIKVLENRETTSWLDRHGAKPGKGLGNLQDGGEYLYKICAVNIADVHSEMCEPVKAMTKKAPATPAAPEVSACDIKAVCLAWAANPEKDIDSYVIEATGKSSSKFKEILRVKNDGGATFKGRHEGLNDGVEYLYRIKAIDVEGLHGAWSVEVTGSTKSRPDAPADLKSEPGPGGVAVKWSPPAQKDIKEYKIFEKGFLRTKLIMTVDKPECVLTEGQVGRKLKVVIAAVDAEGLESDCSVPLDIVQPPVTK